MNQILAALVGAVVAYVGGWSQQLLRRRRERKTLASILLQEVRRLDLAMREVYNRNKRGRLPSKSFPIMQNWRESIRVFSTSTVVELLEVGGLVDNIEDIQERLPDGMLDPTHGTGAQVRGTAYAIIHRIPKVKEALEREGGRLPEWKPVSAPGGLTGPNPPALPPSPYGPDR